MRGEKKKREREEGVKIDMNGKEKTKERWKTRGWMDKEKRFRKNAIKLIGGTMRVKK
jgi:hypothetical protein